MGKCFFSAEIELNGNKLDTLLYTPFVSEIIGHLHSGENEIRVTVVPTKYNSFVLEGIKGNKLFKRMKDSELMSQGMVGPVTIYEQKK